MDSFLSSWIHYASSTANWFFDENAYTSKSEVLTKKIMMNFDGLKKHSRWFRQWKGVIHILFLFTQFYSENSISSWNLTFLSSIRNYMVMIEIVNISKPLKMAIFINLFVLVAHSIGLNWFLHLRRWLINIVKWYCNLFIFQLANATELIDYSDYNNVMISITKFWLKRNCLLNFELNENPFENALLSYDCSCISSWFYHFIVWSFYLRSQPICWVWLILHVYIQNSETINILNGFDK